MGEDFDVESIVLEAGEKGLGDFECYKDKDGEVQIAKKGVKWW
jgi:hypothetical protein